MLQTLTFTGVFTGSSQKTNRPYYMGYFYGSDERNTGLIGFRSLSFFLEEDLFNTLKVLPPLTKVEADVRYINGSNVLLSVKKV